MLGINDLVSRVFALPPLPRSTVTGAAIPEILRSYVLGLPMLCPAIQRIPFDASISFGDPRVCIASGTAALTIYSETKAVQHSSSPCQV